MTGAEKQEHAVVIGGGIAGLSAARALRRAFERVTLVERDSLADDTDQRHGVPQGRHLHVLLTAGSDALEALFPGLVADLVARGAASGDLGERGRSIINGQRLARAATGREDVLCSRPFVEGAVRRRLREDPGVTILDRTRVTALLADERGGKVVGVRLARRAEASDTLALTADLVIDCSGRRSQVPVWLEQLGYGAPPVEELRVDIWYATRCYRLPPRALGDDVFVLIAPDPQHPRAGGLARIEGDRWVVTLVGVAGERPPLDADGFEQYATTLAGTDIADVIRTGQAEGDAVGFHYPGSQRRRYERLRRFPQGLLVLGDALCSFNPIYGQGMSVAAIEAAALGQLLASHGVPSARRWFRRVAPIVDVPWDLAIGGDLSLPVVQGHRSLSVRLINRYMDWYYRAATRDPELSALFTKVSALLEPPARLLLPTTLARVLRASWALGRQGRAR